MGWDVSKGHSHGICLQYFIHHILASTQILLKVESKVVAADEIISSARTLPMVVLSVRVSKAELRLGSRLREWRESQI